MHLGSGFAWNFVDRLMLMTRSPVPRARTRREDGRFPLQTFWVDASAAFDALFLFSLLLGLKGGGGEHDDVLAFLGFCKRRNSISNGSYPLVEGSG